MLAISTLYYGDEDFGHAWTGLGLDIDGKTTTKTSTDVCTLVPGAYASTQTDGENGIDNSFGENLVPLFGLLLWSWQKGDTTFSQGANDALRAGDATTLFRIDQLGLGQDYAPLPGLVYRSTPATNLRWDGADIRDVDPYLSATVISAVRCSR